MLRVAPPFLVGVLTPVIVLLGLALLPYPLDRSEQGVAQWFNRPGRTAQFVFLGVLSDILAFVLRATVR